MDIKLKPCPFCGSSDVGLGYGDYIECKQCGARGFVAGNKVEAARHWNTRKGESDAENK